MVSGINKQQKVANRAPLALLGDLEIDIITAPRSFDFTERSVYSQHDKIERKPGLQYTGESLNEISMDFRLASQWTDPDAQLKRLQAARRAHLSMALILGTGRFAGNYVIEEIRTNVVVTDISGNLDAIEVSVKLKETLTKPPKTKRFGKSPFKKRRR
ncbi:phage tail protein [Leptolyngbya ohadii]|uniref:phage tail protein n=1 Tax=Leptolyngbya ohadii TaxID=1962290 RepID=UPI000B59B15E|nr:phage tail protein [Leptolyngbya ohadii]